MLSNGHSKNENTKVSQTDKGPCSSKGLFNVDIIAKIWYIILERSEEDVLYSET